jgi:hypothetical protein
MAMTLRTSDEDDAALERLSQRYGVSKHQAALLAIRSADQRTSRTAWVADVADEMLQEWGPVFDALANS